MKREKFNKKTLISIVTTAYNESKVIEQTVLSWNRWLKKNNLNSEIIVYDDGSTENTHLILKKIQKKVKNFKFLKGASNKGYGYGMRQAIKIAKGKYLVTIDSDNQYDLSNIKKFFLLFNNKVKCVTGFRYKKKDTFIKVLADLMLRQIVQILFNTKLKDTNCALKMIKADVFKNIKLDSDDYSLPTEICIKIENKGLKILDMPIKHSFRKGGRSSINLIFTSIRFLKFLFFLKYRLIKNNKILNF
jgi:dolichol-phosphate mannosyltransferase